MQSNEKWEFKSIIFKKTKCCRDAKNRKKKNATSKEQSFATK